MYRRLLSCALLTGIVRLPCPADRKQPAGEQSALDQYIAAASQQARGGEASPGSLYYAGAGLASGARDLRAYQVDDLVTIVVSDRASALAKGTVTTSRKSNTSNSITALLGQPSPVGALANLAGAAGDTQLAGEGQTSRETLLTTTITARVTHVLPNGNLVLEAGKEVMVNSERQLITVRGIARPADVNFFNQVRSDRLAMLDLRVNGKGVVGDAIRRPSIIYRILLGLLPF